MKANQLQVKKNNHVNIQTNNNNANINKMYSRFNSSSSSLVGVLTHLLSISRHSNNEVSSDDYDEDGYDNLMPPMPDDYIDSAMF